MRVFRGVFNENGFPVIELEVQGNSSVPHKVKAIIDSGNNGYLTLPYIKAFPLGLILLGTSSAKMADGSSSLVLECQGHVTLGEKKVTTVIDVQPNGRVLIGTALLRDLNVDFVFNPKKPKVELHALDQEEVL